MDSPKRLKRRKPTLLIVKRCESMQFCPKCGGLMLPKQSGEGPVLVCNVCSYVTEEVKSNEYKVVKPARGEEKVAVIEEEAKPVLPTTKAECPKCGNSTAYWWLRQTRAADEATTRFYRCAKCGHIWREYT